MKWLTTLFSKKEKQKTIEVIEIELPKKGEIWYLKSQQENPFKRDKYSSIIKEVREGYVNYSMGWLFNDESMKLDLFTSIYERKTK